MARYFKGKLIIGAIVVDIGFIMHYQKVKSLTDCLCSVKCSRSIGSRKNSCNSVNELRYDTKRIINNACLDTGSKIA